MKIPVARCLRCDRLFELTNSTGCPDCNRGKTGEDIVWDWEHEGWYEEGVMMVWGDWARVVRCRMCGGHPLEVPELGVLNECRCNKSAWSEVDSDVLFVWDSREV